MSSLGSPAAGSKAAVGAGVRAIILAPTRELAHQIHNECMKLAQGRKWRIALFSKATASTLVDKAVRDKVGSWNCLRLSDLFHILLIPPRCNYINAITTRGLYKTRKSAAGQVSYEAERIDKLTNIIIAYNILSSMRQIACLTPNSWIKFRKYWLLVLTNMYKKRSSAQHYLLGLKR